jgi:REP element-mobilizing transposase RayT
MSEKYKFYDSKQPHFISFATINWIDIFTRIIYFNILTESLDHCIKNKGLILNAWVIMTNHIHLIARSETNELGNIMRDMKKFTSKEIVSAIKGNKQESRKKWLSWMIKKAGKANKHNKNYQVWQQNNHPVVLDTNKMIDQRLEYLHMNPVKAGYVNKPEDWKYGSAKQYIGLSKILNLELVV